MQVRIQNLYDEISPTLAEHQNTINSLIADANRAYELSKAEVKDLYDKCDAKFKEHKETLGSMATVTRTAHDVAEVNFASVAHEHTELFRKTELTFQEYERKLNAIEGVTFVEQHRRN